MICTQSHALNRNSDRSYIRVSVNNKIKIRIKNNNTCRVQQLQRPYHDTASQKREVKNVLKYRLSTSRDIVMSLWVRYSGRIFQTAGTEQLKARGFVGGQFDWRDLKFITI